MPRLRRASAPPMIYHYNGGNNALTNNTRYLSILEAAFQATVSASTSSYTVTLLAAHAGVLRNLTVQRDAAPGAGETAIYTVMVNGVASPVTITLSGATAQNGQDTTHTTAISVGDRIDIRVVSSALAAAGRSWGSFEI